MPSWLRDFLALVFPGLNGRPDKPATAAPQPQDLGFLDCVRGIEPSHFTKECPTLAREQIERANALNLLALAESAMLAGERLTAAQLFMWTMISAYEVNYAAGGAARTLVEHANNVILLIAGDRAELKSRIELVLYGHRRLVAALQADGMRQPNIDEWIVAAFAQSIRKFPVREGAVNAAIDELRPESRVVDGRYQSEIGATRKVFECARSLLTANNFNRVAVAEGRLDPFGTLVVLLLVTVGCVFIANQYRGWFSFPNSSGFLDAEVWPGRALCTALVAWPLLLLATWVFAFKESLRKRTFYFISPSHLVVWRRGGGQIVPGMIAGEIMPFGRDRFFHIFQSVWIFLVVTGWLAFRNYDALPAWLQEHGVWNPTSADLSAVLQWVSRANSWSDWIGMALASLFLVGSVAVQMLIQFRRFAGKDIYWWDWRIGRTEFVVRLVMVGLDLFLAVFLVAKMLAMLAVAYKVANSDGLMISYFSFDGVGGLKHLTDLLMHLSWAVFLFGMFVFASLLLHWNLREYRFMDLSLVVAYAVILAIALAPLGFLEKKLSDEKERRLEALTKDPGPKLSEAGDYVKNLALVRDWPASALNVGILGNPVLPLGFQFFVVIIQFLVGAGKLPKLPIPGLSAQEEPDKGAHGVS
jgi:hypothetical protein